jgi:hypothetical protein
MAKEPPLIFTIMNPALAMERQAAAVGLDKLLALMGLPSKRSADRLTETAGAEVFESIKKLLDDLLRQALEARTSQEFTSIRQQVLGDYVRSVRALVDLMRMMVPKRVIERLVWESFSELEAQFREHGIDRFGAPVKDQAIFTIWSLGKTSDLILRIVNAGSVPDSMREADAKLASEFAFCTVWTQFHLDCLTAAIRFDKSIQLEVLDQIQDGLRAAVNAYGLARRGLDLRIPPTEPQLNRPEWDDEDQALLASSMHDMEVETETI